MNIALRFNEMVRRGEVGPIMLGRDHHDVSGTDSPFRETSNIKDGSNVMAAAALTGDKTLVIATSISAEAWSGQTSAGSGTITMPQSPDQW
jgi:urocanate hydratase